jgi:hypothetical protein
MQIINADSPRFRLFRNAAQSLTAFDGCLSFPFHSLRQTLKKALIRWHQTHDPKAVVAGIREEAIAFLDIYASSSKLTGLRDGFEAHLAMAIALSNEHAQAEFLRSKFDFQPHSNGYAYYVGFKQAILAAMLGDKALAAQARHHLSQFNPGKSLYSPSKSVIFATLDGDLTTLRSWVRTVSKKFDGYAQKCHAVNGEVMDVAAFDDYWFSPYPDWAFYAQAIRKFGRIEAEDTFWMPMRLLNSYANG